MTGETGVARLRQAIESQWAAGEACFSLPIGEAIVICDECEDELARLAWAKGVPVPKDADGNVVPLDTTKLYTDKGEMIFVGDIRFDGYRWYVCGTGSGRPYRLKQLHRTGQDSWEKLEEDIQKVARTQDNCPSAALQDVMRRAKALAERDAKASTPQSSSHEAKEADRD